jgi:putative copper resistance protein D
MRPAIGWAANPPMQQAFAAAFLGGLGLLAGDPTLLVAVRVAAEGVAWFLCVRGNGFVAVFGVLAAFAMALAGHARGPGSQFVDAVHVLSAGMWAGGILALAALRPPGGWGSADARTLLERFGRVAVIAFAVTALTGAVRASEQLKDVSDLWTTAYGEVLAVKLAGIVAMLALSVWWRRGRRVARADAVAVAVVVAATAVLAAFPLRA